MYNFFNTLQYVSNSLTKYNNTWQHFYTTLQVFNFTKLCPILHNKSVQCLKSSTELHTNLQPVTKHIDNFYKHFATRYTHLQNFTRVTKKNTKLYTAPQHFPTPTLFFQNFTKHHKNTNLYTTLQTLHNFTNITILYITRHHSTQLYNTLHNFTKVYKPLQALHNLYNPLQQNLHNFTHIYTTLPNYTKVVQNFENST